MALSISQVLLEGGLEAGTHYQLKATGVFGVDVWADALTMLGNTPYPTIEQATAWAITAQAKVDAALVLYNTQTAIRAKAQLAKQYSAEIGMIFNQIIDSDIANSFAGETADICFIRLTGANALGNVAISGAFRTWVMNNFTKETGLSFAMTPTGINNTPLATRQAFNAFCRRFFNSYGLLIIYAA